MGGSDIDEIIYKVMNRDTPSQFEKVKSQVEIPQRDLLDEQENIALLRKYHMALQNVTLSDDMRKFFLNNKRDKR